MLWNDNVFITRTILHTMIDIVYDGSEPVIVLDLDYCSSSGKNEVIDHPINVPSIVKLFEFYDADSDTFRIRITNEYPELIANNSAMLIDILRMLDFLVIDSECLTLIFDDPEHFHHYQRCRGRSFHSSSSSSSFPEYNSILLAVSPVVMLMKSKNTPDRKKNEEGSSPTIFHQRVVDDDNISTIAYLDVYDNKHYVEQLMSVDCPEPYSFMGIGCITTSFDPFGIITSFADCVDIIMTINAPSVIDDLHYSFIIPEHCRNIMLSDSTIVRKIVMNECCEQLIAENCTSLDEVEFTSDNHYYYSRLKRIVLTDSTVSKLSFPRFIHHDHHHFINHHRLSSSTCSSSLSSPRSSFITQSFPEVLINGTRIKGTLELPLSCDTLDISGTDIVDIYCSCRHFIANNCRTLKAVHIFIDNQSSSITGHQSHHTIIIADSSISDLIITIDDIDEQCDRHHHVHHHHHPEISITLSNIVHRPTNSIINHHLEYHHHHIGRCHRLDLRSLLFRKSIINNDDW